MHCNNTWGEKKYRLAKYGQHSYPRFLQQSYLHGQGSRKSFYSIGKESSERLLQRIHEDES